MNTLLIASRFSPISLGQSPGKQRAHTTHTIAQCLARHLERQGLLERDAGSSYLVLDSEDEDPMAQLRWHSITYRIAVGPLQGGVGWTMFLSNAFGAV